MKDGSLIIAIVAGEVQSVFLPLCSLASLKFQNHSQCEIMHLFVLFFPVIIQHLHSWEAPRCERLIYNQVY